MKLLKWMIGNRKPALNKPVVLPSSQHPKYFAEWILENCTYWGNEWFMYRGYRYTANELFEVWNNPKNISNEA